MAVLINLDDFPLEADVRERFSETEDVKVIGAAKGVRSGHLRIIGGRSVSVVGGAYRQNIWLDGFTIQGRIEGVYTRFETGAVQAGIILDAFSLRPAPYARKFASERGKKTRALIINCRAENVQGERTALHGDVYQLAGSTNNLVQQTYIDRLTAYTACQGLFLSPQATGNHVTDESKGYYSREDAPTPEFVRINRVNIGKVREVMADGSKLVLFYPIDEASGGKFGNRGYPRYVSNFYLQPFGREPLQDLLAGNDRTSARIKPIIARSGLHATYPPDVQIFGPAGSVPGLVRYGPPPSGDFVVGSVAMIGGVGKPGRGYRSPVP
jgi:hypothetical protein